MSALGLCALPYDHWLGVLRALTLGDLARLRACTTGLHSRFAPAVAAAAWAAVRPPPAVLAKLYITAPVVGLAALTAAYGDSLAANSSSGLWHTCCVGDFTAAVWHAARAPPTLNYDMWRLACAARNLDLVRWLTAVMGLSSGGPTDLFLMGSTAAAVDPAIVRWAIGYFGWSKEDVRTHLSSFLPIFCESDFDGARWFAALVALGPGDTEAADRAIARAVTHGRLDIARWLAELCEVSPTAVAQLATGGLEFACMTGELDRVRQIVDAYAMAPYAPRMVRSALSEAQLGIAEWLIVRFNIDGECFRKKCWGVLPELYRRGRLDELHWLAARYGPDTIRTCYSQREALVAAIESDRLPVVKWAVALYAISRRAVQDCQLLGLVVQHGGVDVAAWLVDQYALTVYDIPCHYETCHYLAANGRIAMIAWLAEAFPSIMQEQGANIAFFAVQSHQRAVVQLMIDQKLGGLPDAGWKLIGVACDANSVGIAGLLAKHCRFPTEWNRVVCVRRTLRKAATVVGGNTAALMWIVETFCPPRRMCLRAFLAACSYGNLEAAKLLAAVGAVTPKDSRVLRRAACVAWRRRHRGVVRWLTAEFRQTLDESIADGVSDNSDDDGGGSRDGSESSCCDEQSDDDWSGGDSDAAEN